MDLVLLATIQLNRAEGGGDLCICCADFLYAEQIGTGGTRIHFRDNRKPEHVTETVTQVQTAINALWDEYAT